MSATVWDKALTCVSEGTPIDWDALLGEAESPAERAKIDDLRALCEALGSNSALADLPAPETIGVSAPSAHSAPERWGSLEILEVIGNGSQGVVYRAWDTRLAREVALKLIVDSGSGADSLSEARRLARITHPNVVTVFGADRANGRVGIWMELVAGRTLEQIIREQGPYSVREAVGVAIEVCGAVAAIHKAGLIHRDIKAQNVMRLPGGRILVMDLGSSQEPAPDESPVGGMAGTPLYMAPELFTGSPATPASDVYAVGVLLYRMVTGEFPVEAATLGDVRRAHQRGQLRPLRAVRPDLPTEFVALVGRCLSAEPASRFRTTAQLERALIDLGQGGLNRPSRMPGWRAAVGFATIGAGIVTAAPFTWKAIQRPASSTGSVAVSGPTSDQAAVLLAYQDVAFSSLTSEPQRSARAMEAGINVIRSTMPGQHPWFTLLHAQHAEARRAAGDSEKARAALDDASAHVHGTGTQDHPYSAVLAMERARYLQGAGHHAQAAAEIARALGIRWRILQLDLLSTQKTPRLSEAALASASTAGATLTDTDGDSIADVVERAAGLNSLAMDSDKDGVDDGDADRDRDGVPNRLELGMLGLPFLSWGHYGSFPPRELGWRSQENFPVVEAALGEPHDAWSITAPQGGTQLAQTLASSQTARAMRAGFVLFVRGEAVKGVADAVVDLAPTGPRFDVVMWPREAGQIKLLLPTSIAPLEGQQNRVPARAWPLIELRFHPGDGTVRLYSDGRLVQRDYRGFHKFQGQGSGSVVFAVGGDGDGARNVTARYQLVWLEIR